MVTHSHLSLYLLLVCIVGMNTCAMPCCAASAAAMASTSALLRIVIFILCLLCRSTFAKRFSALDPFQERFVAAALRQVDAAGLLEGGGGAIRILLVDHREPLAAADVAKVARLLECARRPDRVLLDTFAVGVEVPDRHAARRIAAVAAPADVRESAGGVARD